MLYEKKDTIAIDNFLKRNKKGLPVSSSKSSPVGLLIKRPERRVDLALELGKDAFSRNIDDVSPTGRTLLKAIVELVNENYTVLKQEDPNTERTLADVPFTRKALREEIGWSETQVRRNIDHLVELGYIGRINGRHGSTFRYVLLDTGEEDPTVEFRMGALEKEGWK